MQGGVTTRQGEGKGIGQCFFQHSEVHAITVVSFSADRVALLSLARCIAWHMVS